VTGNAHEGVFSTPSWGAAQMENPETRLNNKIQMIFLMAISSVAMANY